MIEVWLGAGALAVLAVVHVVVGARRRRNDTDEAAAAAVFADRRREIRAEARMQGLDESEVAALEEELALDSVARVADDEAAMLARVDEAGKGTRPAPLPLLAATIGAALAAIGLYALWGEPNAPVLAEATARMEAAARGGVDAQGDPVALAELERALVARLGRKPGDANGWFVLGHVRMRRSDFGGAVDAFASLHELTGSNEQVDLSWAQASYLADGHAVTAETQAIIERVFAVRPDHPDMLELLAMDAIRRAEFSAAASYLARAVGQSLPAARRALLEETLALTRARLDPERPFIDVVVTVEGTPAPWLMVFARPVGGGMPLAAVRRPAQAVQSVVLDDAASMNPALPLSAGGLVEVVARVSEAGTATASDVEAVSAPLDAKTRPRVELTLAAAGASGEVEPAGGVAVEISLAVAVDAAVPVFVIARSPSQPGPPVAVRRLVAGELPTRIRLTDADAMTPGRRLSDLAEVELLARASLGGTPSARSGDLESAAIAVHVGAALTKLRIDRRVP